MNGSLKYIYYIVNELEIGTFVRVQDFRKNHSISASVSEVLRGLALCQHVLFVLDWPARTQPAVTWNAWPPAGLNTQIVGRQTYSGKWYSVCLRYKRTILGKYTECTSKLGFIVRYVTNLLFEVTILWYSTRFAEPIWSGLLNTLSIYRDNLGSKAVITHNEQYGYMERKNK